MRRNVVVAVVAVVVVVAAVVAAVVAVAAAVVVVVAISLIWDQCHESWQPRGSMSGGPYYKTNSGSYWSRCWASQGVFTLIE